MRLTELNPLAGSSARVRRTCAGASLTCDSVVVARAPAVRVATRLRTRCGNAGGDVRSSYVSNDRGEYRWIAARPFYISCAGER